MPLGTSHSRLTIWKTLSARPISHRENPRAASSATHTASVIRRPEKKSAVYTQPSCRLMLSVDCLFDFMESTFSFLQDETVPILRVSLYNLSVTFGDTSPGRRGLGIAQTPSFPPSGELAAQQTERVIPKNGRTSSRKCLRVSFFEENAAVPTHVGAPSFQ